MKSILTFKEYIIESFNNDSTGNSRIDKIIKNPELYKATVTIRVMKPERIQELMAKAQGTTSQKAIERRKKMPGFISKINNLKKLINQGVKLDTPFIEVTSSGSIQDGFHRTIVAQELGITKMPFILIKRNKR